MISFLFWVSLVGVGLVVYLVWSRDAATEREYNRRHARYAVPVDMRSCATCDHRERPGYLEPCQGCLTGFYLNSDENLRGWE